MGRLDDLRRAADILRRAPQQAHTQPSPYVTRADIEAAYRLLLGRDPDADGLRYWQTAVGATTVVDFVGAFCDSREFHTGPLYARLGGGDPQRTSGRQEERVELPGRVQFVDPADGFVGQQIVTTGTYEPHLTAALTDSLRPGQTFIDVGANIGWFALLAASLVGDGRVVAIEASQDNAETALRSGRASGFQNLVVLPVAAAATSCSLVLQGLGGTNGAVFADGDTVAGDHVVQALALDDLRPLLDCFDVVKIDVEGYELEVLRGAAGLIADHRPVLYIEYSPDMMSRVPDAGPAEFNAWITGNDYGIEVIAYEGDPVAMPSLDAVDAYLTAGQHQHLDLRLTPR